MRTPTFKQKGVGEIEENLGIATETIEGVATKDEQYEGWQGAKDWYLQFSIHNFNRRYILGYLRLEGENGMEAIENHSFVAQSPSEATIFATREDAEGWIDTLIEHFIGNPENKHLRVEIDAVEL